MVYFDFGPQNNSLNTKIIKNQSKPNTRFYIFEVKCHVSLPFLQLKEHSTSSKHSMLCKQFVWNYTPLLACICTKPILICAGYLLREVCMVVGVLRHRMYPDWFRWRGSNKVASYRDAAGERHKQGRENDTWSATESNCSLTLSLRGKGKNILAGTPVGSVDRERDSHWQNRDIKTKRRKKYPEFSFFPCSGLLKLPFSHGPTQLQVICPRDTGDAEIDVNTEQCKEGGKVDLGTNPRKTSATNIAFSQHDHISVNSNTKSINLLCQSLTNRRTICQRGECVPGQIIFDHMYVLIRGT